MNIVVLSASGKVFVRPDTTWERDSEDFYVPEFIDSVSFTPVFFARVSKPGRSVSEKFAGRYFDGLGFGVLLYPENLLDGSEEAFACASCVDHTSFLPFPVLAKGTPSTDGTVSKDGTEAFREVLPAEDAILKAIAEVTRFCYIRTGDIIAIELSSRQPLCSRTESKASVTTSAFGEEANFNIIF